MAVKFRRFRQDSLLPGTGRHWNDPTSGSGYHRVTLMIDSFKWHEGALSVPVHVLAQGKTASGGLVLDETTGEPYTIYDEILTPDILFYDLPPVVASLDVQGICLGDPDDKLVFDAKVDGEPYPGAKSWSQIPTQPIGGMRSALAHIMIDVLALFRRGS